MADDKKVIFSMVNVSKSFTPTKQVLKNIYLSFFYGAKIGIIGLNGSGKSTLLKIIAGVDKSFDGEVVFSPGYSVGYLEQEPKFDEDKTVIEVVREGVADTMALLAEFEEINAAFAEPDADFDKLLARQAEIQDRLDACDAWNIDTRLRKAMDALRCPEEDTPVKHLSGGERRRVALCRLLLQQPDILLLDEPTNHLDAESIDWLEQHLQQYAGTVIAITHDRYFLDHVAGWILELDRGEGIPWKGNYSGWLEQKTARMAMEEKQMSKRRKTLERELEWVRMAPSARHAKGKARLNAYDRLLNEDQKAREEKLEIFIPNGPRLGNKVIEAKGSPHGVNNDGRLCLKGLYGWDYLNDPQILTKRIRTPLIRRGGKGTPLEPASWEEAVRYTAERLKAIIKEYGPDSVMGAGSARGPGNEVGYLTQKFMRAVVGTNNVDHCARI